MAFCCWWWSAWVQAQCLPMASGCSTPQCRRISPRTPTTLACPRCKPCHISPHRPTPPFTDRWTLLYRYVDSKAHNHYKKFLTWRACSCDRCRCHGQTAMGQVEHMHRMILACSAILWHSLAANLQLGNLPIPLSRLQSVSCTAEAELHGHLSPSMILEVSRLHSVSCDS